MALVFLSMAVATEDMIADAIEIVRTGIAHDALYALDMNGEKGLAVGNFGLMLETTDAGATWTVTEPVTEQALLGIATTGDRQIVVGQGGTVLTRAGGGAWEQLNNDPGPRLFNVGMHESGLVVAVGEFGAIVRSHDFGASWETITLDWAQYNDEGYEAHLYDVVIKDEETVVLAGEFGLILWSEDGGDTFTVRHTGDESIFDIELDAKGGGTGWAVGQNGMILRSQDAGQTWQRIDAGSAANLLGVWSGQGEVVIVGIRELLRSSDDGKTWRHTDDIKIIRTWYQGIDAGVAEIEASNRSLHSRTVYVAGDSATLSRILE